ncbi:hypothetical protein [Patulibacter defluvii]|uniref:hypothetical protein n=1 Tax=Patulibacter defluvii TaxID=3095358 RepID=UPI002A754CF9|nr:hypothetical protein [Patulibacter sp. DM4]
MTKLDLVGVLTGQKQLFDEVKTVTCPLTQGVVDVLKPVLGASVATLETVGCGDNAVDYQFVTKLKTPSGEIVRKQLALVAVPTKLNVDADPEPDVIGTISVINLKKFEIRIERLPGEKAELPLQVEALIDDPLNGGIPREHINVGYDARNSRAPQRWTATAELPKTAEGTTDIDIRVTQTGAGPELTTLGGLYDGSADRRTSPMGARLKFAPAPSLSRMGLSLGPTRTVVRAGSGTPTTLDASAELEDGPSRKEIDVHVGPLPETLQVAFDDLGPDQRKIVYAASAPVEDVAARYVDRVDGAVDTKVVAKAHGLPTGMTVEQTSAKSGSFTATGGTLGSVEAGFANGDPQLLAKDHPYVNVQTDGPVHSFAGRIDDLQSASFDAADGIVANLQLGNGPRKPLDAVVNTPELDVAGQVSDLPRKIGFRFAPSTGTINYDAFGETIQQITAKATAPQPLIGRAIRVDGTIRDLPPKADIAITPGSGGIDLRTTAPIGQVEALLSSGPDGGLEPDQLGADIVDTDERFVAHARVEGLQAVKLAIDKDQQGAFDGFRGDVELATQPIDLRYRGSDGIDAQAQIRDLPKHLRIGFSPRKGTVNYDAFGEAIQRISVTATGNKPFIGRATRVDGTIRDLPPKAEIVIRPENGGIDLRTTAAIGQIEALLSSGPDGGLAPDETGADIVDTTERFVAHGRINGFRGAQVEIDRNGQDEMTALRGSLQMAQQPLALRYRSDDITAAATVRDVPGELHLGFLPREGRVNYDASGGTIDTITVDAKALDTDGDPATDPKPLLGRATRIRGTIQGLPAKADVVAAPGGGGVDLTTDTPIGNAEVLLTSGPDGGLAAGEQGVDLVNTPAAFVAHARIKGLRQAHVAITEAPVQQGDGTTKDELQKLDAHLQVAAQPIVVRYAADPACADGDPATRPTAGVCFDGDLSTIPDDVRVTFDRPNGAITYDASAPIDSLGARVESASPLFGEARKIDARIERLPKEVTVGFKPAEGFDDGVDVSTDERVGSIKAKITDGTTTAPELVDGQAKVALRKLPGQFAIAAQLFEISGGKIGLKSYAPDPTKPDEKSTRVAAELHLGPLAGNERQDVDLDVQADKPDDATERPLNLTGRIDDIPDDMTLDLDAERIHFTSSTKIPKVAIDARNLPQGKPGEDLTGKPQNVRATIEQIPTELTVDMPKPAQASDPTTIGLTPNGELGRVDVELWDVGAPWEALPEGGRNKLRFDKRTGLHVQGRLLPGLESARLTLPGSSGTADDKLAVKTGFARNPAPLDIELRSGIGVDRSLIRVNASDLKRTQEFTLLDRKGMRIGWRSNEPGTDLKVQVSTEKLGTDLDVSDLPASADVCVAGDHQCLPYILRFSIRDKEVRFDTGVTSLTTTASGPLKLNGWICLPPTDDDGNPNGGVYDDCLDRSASNRLTLDDLELKDVTFAVFSGDTIQRNSSGDGPLEDNILMLHMRIDSATGLAVRRLAVENKRTDKETIVGAGWKNGQRVSPLKIKGRVEPMFNLLQDLDKFQAPPYETHAKDGHLTCDAANLSVRVDGLSVLGLADLFKDLCDG